MFAIRQIKISDKEQEILNICLSDAECQSPCAHNYTTLVLGENGVGKSFLLKAIIDIFCFLETLQDCHRKRKPRYQYTSFYIEYQLCNDIYCVNRISGSQIIAKRNGERIDYKEVALPQKVLAISFMVNDKFQFNKDEDGGIYTYHGVRSSTNSTYTSSISRSIAFDLIHCIEKGLTVQVAEIFSILKFDPMVEFQWKSKGKTVTAKIDLTKSSSHISQLSDKQPVNNLSYSNACFFKNGQKISFDLCSSGEKHILFAYIGILSRISNRTLVLIDEPEISLHPEWQLKYISTVSKLFDKYENCCFILASHSHYFVSELQGDSSTIVVLKKDSSCNAPKAEVIPFDTYSWSAENIIYNVFGIRTSRNFYFESDLSDLLDNLNSFDGSESERINIQRKIDKLEKYVFNANDPLYLILKDAKEKIK